MTKRRSTLRDLADQHARAMAARMAAAHLPAAIVPPLEEDLPEAGGGLAGERSRERLDAVDLSTTGPEILAKQSMCAA